MSHAEPLLRPAQPMRINHSVGRHAAEVTRRCAPPGPGRDFAVAVVAGVRGKHNERGATGRGLGGWRTTTRWYAFGTHDGYHLWEAPDNVSMASVALAISGGGALSSFETTVLLTVEETLDALAGAEHIRYRAPGAER
ncbi:GYD domain-containing protein [Streptomyces sp. NPDC086023]|uniref:GYD domain-containing protein n=1 Tax=Streptomyces sp. NPDC086023 TaxID=3365746 RepID=UPI0037CFAD11